MVTQYYTEDTTGLLWDPNADNTNISCQDVVHKTPQTRISSGGSDVHDGWHFVLSDQRRHLLSDTSDERSCQRLVGSSANAKYFIQCSTSTGSSVTHINTIYWNTHKEHKSPQHWENTSLCEGSRANTFGKAECVPVTHYTFILELNQPRDGGAGRKMCVEIIKKIYINTREKYKIVLESLHSRGMMSGLLFYVGVLLYNCAEQAEVKESINLSQSNCQLI